MSLRILRVVVVAICTLSARIAAAQQCGDAADLTCNGSCGAGAACDVSQSGLGCECVFGAAMLGLFMGHALPEHHVSPESKDGLCC